MRLKTNKDRITLVTLNRPDAMYALSRARARGWRSLDPEGRGQPPAEPKAAR